MEDHHNGAYEDLYVKKGKAGGDHVEMHHMQRGPPMHVPLPEEMAMAMGAGAPMGGHKKNLSVEIPGGDSMLNQLGELNTPNSIAMFQQLGNSLLPVRPSPPVSLDGTPLVCAVPSPPD